LWQRALRGGVWRGLVRPAYGVARRLRLPLAGWVGYAERDWHNLLYSGFVSPVDFLANRGRPYYLVQSIPPRRRPGAVPAHRPVALPPLNPAPDDPARHGRRVGTRRE
jgi:hypothetical protein